jgi:hypothetical protein
MNEFSKRLVLNLKALNSKERDHLMRFAYLGANDNYDSESVRWLSQEMEELLLAPESDLQLSPDARCVFAGMDYHLDWLYVAIKAACEGKELNTTTFEGQMGDHAKSGDGPDDPSLWSVSGSQEDLDMLVVFADGDRTTLLFVEAKGVAVFNKPQLGRKLVRLDRIWETSGAHKRSADLSCKLVLVGPKEPEIGSCIDFARSIEPAWIETHSNLIEAMKTHATGIGSGLNFIKLDNFPTKPLKVTRERDENSSEFVRWKVEPRR